MRTKNQSLASLLFGRTRSQLLATIYLDASGTFFVRQLARELCISPGTVQRELTTLTRARLLLRTEKDQRVIYTANREHPVYEDLRSLLRKTNGVFPLVQNALRTLEEGIESAFIYGSFARGEETADSDVDVLVIGEAGLDDILSVLGPLERKLHRAINPTVYAGHEARAKIRSGNHFLKSLQKAPLISLTGSEDEFRKIR